MKVKYDGPADTYHPQLGKLFGGKPFDLDDVVAEKYIKSGLLKKVFEPKPVKQKTKAEPDFSSAKKCKGEKKWLTH